MRQDGSCRRARFWGKTCGPRNGNVRKENSPTAVGGKKKKKADIGGKEKRAERDDRGKLIQVLGREHLKGVFFCEKMSGVGTSVEEKTRGFSSNWGLFEVKDIFGVHLYGGDSEKKPSWITSTL